MTLVLSERNAAVRGVLEDLLRCVGARKVFTFASAEVAFLFLLGHAAPIDGIVLNEDDEGARQVLRRLEVTPRSCPAVTYSGQSLERAMRDAGTAHRSPFTPGPWSRSH